MKKQTMWDRMSKREGQLVKEYLKNLSIEMLNFALQEIKTELKKRKTKKII